MTTWFLIALAAPALWALSNHIDKYLIEKYFKGGGVGALMIFSSIVALFVLPFIVIVHPNVLGVSTYQALVLILGGILYILSIYLYLHALQKEETSLVAPLFQAIPVFSFFLGLFVLGEMLSVRQITGALIVIAASILLSLDFDSKRLRVKSSMLVIMITASFLVALSALIFKVYAIETDYWTASFWGYIGHLIMGVIFLVFFKSYRKDFLRILKDNKTSVLGMNMFNEVLTIIGDFLFRFATLLAPLALVTTVEGIQPFFVFLYGIIMTIFMPRFGKESLKHSHLMQRFIALIFMFLGTYILNT